MQGESNTTTHYDWQHSDYGQSGSIICAHGDITEVMNGSDTLLGTFDATTDPLVWEGVTYTP